MRRVGLMAGAALVVLLAACGGPEGGLPTGTGGEGAPGEVQQLPPENTPPQTPESLWPLTEGSSWRYRITDDVKGVFEKKVTVLGLREVPGLAGATAIAVRNDEPTLNELSFEVVSPDGMVLRVREEDSKDGVLVRVARFNPALMKALAVEKPAGWMLTFTVTETEEDGAGVVVNEKQKTWRWTVVATGVEVTVPAGTFPNAVHLKRERTDKPDYLREYWLVPGVGKVRETGERTEELLHVDVKQGVVAE